MQRAGFHFLITGLIIFFALSPSLFAQENQTPKFDEVYQLLRENVRGLTEAELNRAAVKGLLAELQSQAVLVNNTSAEAAASSSSLNKTSVFDEAFAYFRVGNIESGLNENLISAYRQLLLTNKLKGVVLDLRYASGTDYAAAAKTADLFIKTEQPLLRWGDASANATAKTNAITMPVAVLVNHETSGAAEALAGMLREAQAGLVIGTNTAGQASVFKEFPLENGQRLKIASAPVKLGSGKRIPDEGLKPDIEVAVGAEDEKAFYENAYRELPKRISFASADSTNAVGSAETNRPRRRLNEAELVRMQREGISAEDIFDAAAKSPEPSKPVVTDPALVRALDLLKGLAVVQRQAESRRN